MGPVIRRWHTQATLALLLGQGLLVQGCYMDHGPGADAGARPDAGPECAREPSPPSFACPPSALPHDAVVTLEVEHGITECCSARAPQVEVRSTGPYSHRVESSWEVCSCCEACECLGPRETRTVTLGPLAAGRHVLEGGGTSCVIDVGMGPHPPPPVCELYRASEARGPTVLYPDQPLGVTARSLDAGGHCGCRPALSGTGVGSTLDFELCDCCIDCDCIDFGYEVGWMSDPRPVGAHHFVFGGVEHHVQVVRPESCSPRTAEGLAIVGPDSELSQGGRALWWAYVRGTEVLCCAEPAPAIRHERGPDGGFDLELASCVMADCACGGTPVGYGAWHLLGELTPGSYVVRIDGIEERFEVP